MADLGLITNTLGFCKLDVWARAFSLWWSDASSNGTGALWVPLGGAEFPFSLHLAIKDAQTHCCKLKL